MGRHGRRVGDASINRSLSSSSTQNEYEDVYRWKRQRNLNGNPHNTYSTHHPQQWQLQAPTYMNYGAPPPGFPGNFSFSQQQMPCEFQGPLMDFHGPKSAFSRKLPPTRASQNDYAQHYVDTGIRPQNFIRDPDMSVVPDEYPHLKELMKLKDQQILKRSFNPVYLKCDLRETRLSKELFGTTFDAILIDPPMEEYVRRAPGVLDATDFWTWEDIRSLEIEAIADNPCFIFLWVGSNEGLAEGRLCFKKWGFKRIDDICWLKTNHESRSMSDFVNRDSNSIFKRTKEHCLVGLKGMISADMQDHLMHPNIDADIVISEEPPYGSTQKPDYVYNIIEHLVQGRRRIEIFGADHNLRHGWLTIGNALSSSNFNLESYVRNFVNLEGKVWERVDAPHLTGTTSAIEDLRPKSPSSRKRQNKNRLPNQEVHS
ncbi:hypothetical protein SUGI_1193490 [Cryptomeria japonica]|nr:hypothetical protein SUGI_1193490 [Cryptomeria japonica]